MNEEVKDLIKKYTEIVNSPDNQEKKKLWSNTEGWYRDLLRPTPAPGHTPFVIVPDNSLWHYILGINLDEYYADPLEHLKGQIRMKLYLHEHFPDDFFFINDLYIWFSVITELSFYGAKINYFKEKEPWIEGPVIESYDQLDHLEEIDFFSSGVMKKAHRFYEVFNEFTEVTGSTLNTMFPQWARGPFCLAMHLRGMQEALMDTILDPEGLHRFMRRITDDHKKFSAARDKFLGTKQTSTKLWNDEIDGASISPQVYRDFVLPYEKELKEHYGSIRYWHSCGNTDSFLEDIRELNVEMFNVGPWTSYRKAASILGPDVALDICLHPTRDVIDSTPEKMKECVLGISESCKGVPHAIRADAIMYQGNDLEQNLSQMHMLRDIAMKELN